MERHHPYKRVQRMRCCVFTLFNYSDEEESALADAGYWTYLTYGKEICPDTGTPHLQGYAEFATPRQRNTIRGYLFDRAHVEPRKGSQAQAIAYCHKDGDVVEIGVKSEQGKRTDLEYLMNLVSKGEDDLSLFYTDPPLMFQYASRFREFRNLLATHRDRQVAPDVRFYHGPTSTGKTRAVWDEFPDVSSHLAGRWFDSYVPCRAYLFDDLTDSVFPIAHLLRILDRYPLDVEVKGGSVRFNPTCIIITSNTALDLWYPDESPVRRAAFARRFTTVRHFLIDDPAGIYEEGDASCA